MTDTKELIAEAREIAGRIDRLESAALRWKSGDQAGGMHEHSDLIRRLADALERTEGERLTIASDSTAARPVGITFGPHRKF